LSRELRLVAACSLARTRFEKRAERLEGVKGSTVIERPVNYQTKKKARPWIPLLWLLGLAVALIAFQYLLPYVV
jgi:hypothetical protein